MITSFHFFQFERLRCILLSDFFFIDEISREEEWKKLERNETKRNGFSLYLFRDVEGSWILRFTGK